MQTGPGSIPNTAVPPSSGLADFTWLNNISQQGHIPLYLYTIIMATTPYFAIVNIYEATIFNQIMHFFVYLYNYQVILQQLWTSF